MDIEQFFGKEMVYANEIYYKVTTSEMIEIGGRSENFIKEIIDSKNKKDINLMLSIIYKNLYSYKIDYVKIIFHAIYLGRKSVERFYSFFVDCMIYLYGEHYVITHEKNDDTFLSCFIQFSNEEKEKVIQVVKEKMLKKKYFIITFI